MFDSCPYQGLPCNPNPNPTPPLTLTLVQEDGLASFHRHRLASKSSAALAQRLMPLQLRSIDGNFPHGQATKPAVVASLALMTASLCCLRM